MALTSIITVNYNQPGMTLLLLSSLKQFASADDIEVIIVDNGSMEDCGEIFRNAYPGLVYIRSEKNLGFAGGNNLGIQEASGKYLLFLNNDTEITEYFIPVLCRELEDHPEIGLLSPLILFFDDKSKIQYAGYTEMNYLTGRNSGLSFMDTDRGQYDQSSALTGYCHGAAMICRKEDLTKTGLMDESYFLYYEELDWCEKFKRSGKQIGFTGKARIYHKESMSVGKESGIKTYFMTRNRWLFIRRNTGWLTTVLFSIYYLLIVFPLSAIQYSYKGKFKLTKALFKGIWWNITHSKNSHVLGYNLHK